MLPGEPKPDLLSEKHQMTLILRILLDEHNRLVHGELVDVSGKSWGHFSGLNSLDLILKEWLTKQAQQES